MMSVCHPDVNMLYYRLQAILIQGILSQQEASLDVVTYQTMLKETR